jgi:hypothetical protein
MRYIARPRGKNWEPMEGGNHRKPERPRKATATDSIAGDASKTRPDMGVRRMVIAAFTDMRPLSAPVPVGRPSTFRSERAERALASIGIGLRVFVPA